MDADLEGVLALETSASHEILSAQDAALLACLQNSLATPTSLGIELSSAGKEFSQYLDSFYPALRKAYRSVFFHIPLTAEKSAEVLTAAKASIGSRACYHTFSLEAPLFRMPVVATAPVYAESTWLAGKMIVPVTVDTGEGDMYWTWTVGNEARIHTSVPEIPSEVHQSMQQAKERYMSRPLDGAEVSFHVAWVPSISTLYSTSLPVERKYLGEDADPALIMRVTQERYQADHVVAVWEPGGPVHPASAVLRK